MQGAIVSSLADRPTVIDGVEKSTSQVTHKMLPPFETRLSASDRVWAGFSCVLAMSNLILRPSTPPAALILLASISAPYRAGSSVGAISAVKSIAAPITIGLPLLDDDDPPLELELVLEPELAAAPLALLLLLLLDPHPAMTTATAAASASASTEPLNFLMSGSPPGLKRQRGAPTAVSAVLCAGLKCGMTRSANISWVLI